MSDVWLDRLWVIIALALLATAASGAAWAVFGDAIRRRRSQWTGNPTPRRCGKCWYDMTGVAGLRCPECGREARSERGLLRSKRRWGWAAAACVLLLPAHVAWRMPAVREHGWVRLVPTVVLVSWPTNVGAWRYEPTGWVGKELEARQYDELLGRVSARILAARVQAYWKSLVPANHDVVILDVGRVVQDRIGPPETGDYYQKMGLGEPTIHVVPHAGYVERHTREFGNLLEGWIQAENQVEIECRVVDIGRFLVLEASPEHVRRARGLIEMLGDPRVQSSALEWEDLTVMALKSWRHSGPTTDALAQDHADRVRRFLTEVVASEAWSDNGGSDASVTLYKSTFIINGPADLRAQSRAYLGALHDGVSTRLGPFTAACVPNMRPEYIAMWPVHSVLRAWGARTVEELAEESKREHPELGEPDGIWASDQADHEAENAFQSLSVRRIYDIEPDEWEHDAKLFLVGDMAVLWTTHTDLINLVEAALKEAEKGPRKDELE